MLQSSHSIPGSERNRMHRKGLLFLLPLSHLSLTKAVKCFLVHLLSHRIYTWWIKRTRVEKSTCQGSHPLPLLQQPWEQNMLPCHVQPECATPSKWKEEGDTIWRSQFWQQKSKKDVQDKGERGEEQGGKDIGKKATQKSQVTAASSAPGKKRISHEMYS